MAVAHARFLEKPREHLKTKGQETYWSIALKGKPREKVRLVEVVHNFIEGSGIAPKVRVILKSSKPSAEKVSELRKLILGSLTVKNFFHTSRLNEVDKERVFRYVVALVAKQSGLQHPFSKAVAVPTTPPVKVESPKPASPKPSIVVPQRPAPKPEPTKGQQEFEFMKKPFAGSKKTEAMLRMRQALQNKMPSSRVSAKPLSEKPRQMIFREREMTGIRDPEYLREYWVDQRNPEFKLESRGVEKRVADGRKEVGIKMSDLDDLTQKYTRYLDLAISRGKIKPEEKTRRLEYLQEQARLWGYDKIEPMIKKLVDKIPQLQKTPPLPSIARAGVSSSKPKTSFPKPVKYPAHPIKGERTEIGRVTERRYPSPESKAYAGAVSRNKALQKPFAKSKGELVSVEGTFKDTTRQRPSRIFEKELPLWANSRFKKGPQEKHLEGIKRGPEPAKGQQEFDFMKTPFVESEATKRQRKEREELQRKYGASYETKEPLSRNPKQLEIDFVADRRIVDILDYLRIGKLEDALRLADRLPKGYDKSRAYLRIVSAFVNNGYLKSARGILAEREKDLNAVHGTLSYCEVAKVSKDLKDLKKARKLAMDIKDDLEKAEIHLVIAETSLEKTDIQIAEGLVNELKRADAKELFSNRLVRVKLMAESPRKPLDLLPGERVVVPEGEAREAKPNVRNQEVRVAVPVLEPIQGAQVSETEKDINREKADKELISESGAVPAELVDSLKPTNAIGGLRFNFTDSGELEFFNPGMQKPVRIKARNSLLVITTDEVLVYPERWLLGFPKKPTEKYYYTARIQKSTVLGVCVLREFEKDKFKRELYVISKGPETSRREEVEASEGVSWDELNRHLDRATESKEPAKPPIIEGEKAKSGEVPPVQEAAFNLPEPGFFLEPATPAEKVEIERLSSLQKEARDTLEVILRSLTGIRSKEGLQAISEVLEKRLQRLREIREEISATENAESERVREATKSALNYLWELAIFRPLNEDAVGNYNRHLEKGVPSFYEVLKDSLGGIPISRRSTRGLGERLEAVSRKKFLNPRILSFEEVVKRERAEEPHLTVQQFGYKLVEELPALKERYDRGLIFCESEEEANEILNGKEPQSVFTYHYVGVAGRRIKAREGTAKILCLVVDHPSGTKVKNVLDHIVGIVSLKLPEGPKPAVRQPAEPLKSGAQVAGEAVVVERKEEEPKGPSVQVNAKNYPQGADTVMIRRPLEEETVPRGKKPEEGRTADEQQGPGDVSKDDEEKKKTGPPKIPEVVKFGVVLNLPIESENINYFVDAFKQVTDPDVKSTLEKKIVQTIDKCEEEGRLGSVVDLLKENLSDPINISVTMVCANNGWIEPIADFLENRSLNSETREIVEKQLARIGFVNAATQGDAEKIIAVLDRPNASRTFSRETYVTAIKVLSVSNEIVTGDFSSAIARFNKVLGSRRLPFSEEGEKIKEVSHEFESTLKLYVESRNTSESDLKHKQLWPRLIKLIDRLIANTETPEGEIIFRNLLKKHFSTMFSLMEIRDFVNLGVWKQLIHLSKEDINARELFLKTIMPRLAKFKLNEEQQRDLEHLKTL